MFSPDGKYLAVAGTRDVSIPFYRLVYLTQRFAAIRFGLPYTGARWAVHPSRQGRDIRRDVFV